MGKSTPRYGTRNRLAANREDWYEKERIREQARNGVRQQNKSIGDTHNTEITDESLIKTKIGIGRFLFSKREARSPRIESNPLVQIAANYQSMNRHRGVATTPADIMLLYQTPADVAARIALTQTLKATRYLTEKGKREHALDLKARIAAAFREQSATEATHLDAQLRAEQQAKREHECLSLERDFPHLAYDEDEFEDIMVDVDAEGANALNGSMKDGVLFVSQPYFNGLKSGLKVKKNDELTAAQMQHDVDRINQVYDRFGMISGDVRELQVDELSLFVPLFTCHNEELSHELYLPYIPQTRIAFHELGIHKIQ